MSILKSPSLRCCSFPGLIPYAAAQVFLERQAQARAAEKIPDTLYFMEHAPVFTYGRGVPPSTVSELAAIPVVGTDRGGGWTYHGPGQLMIYPVIHLVERDIHAYLRNLENWLIEGMSMWGVDAHVYPGKTGVWIEHQKVASMGIAVRRWVAFHGVALNVVNDLSPFRSIRPCGFDPTIMTRLGDWCSHLGVSPEWRKRIEGNLVALA